MRKSRLYLGLSIISLIVGVAMGEAREWGVDCHGGCPFDRHVQCETRCDRDLAETPVSYHYHEAFRMVQTRDYDAMAEHAQVCVDREGDSISYEMLAYARRGQGLHTESIALYTRAMEELRYESHTLDDRDLIVADCLVGRAANYIAIGNHGLAQRDLREAKKIAERRVERHDGKSAHYQLACVFATRSLLADDDQARDDVESALSELKLAINREYDNWLHMRGDLDLTPLHGNSEFHEISR